MFFFVHNFVKFINIVILNEKNVILHIDSWIFN